MKPTIGIIGGSGLYSMPGFEAHEERHIETPWGPPSDAYIVGRLAGKEVAFLARHGRGHRISPSELNFRANIYGMKWLGVERILSLSAVGSLKVEHKPLDFVIPDQFVDRTRGRVSTFFGDGLVAIDQKTNATPNLAESFEPSDDAKSWVYKLRKGVTFHNGKTLTADDVVATYNYHRGQDSKSAAKSALSTIADVKADGPGTVVFTLTGGSADFPYITSDYHLPIYPSQDGKIDWSKGVGTGPFVLENFEPGGGGQLQLRHRGRLHELPGQPDLFHRVDQGQRHGHGQALQRRWRPGRLDGMGQYAPCRNFGGIRRWATL
jgi:hypothetical protein